MPITQDRMLVMLECYAKERSRGQLLAHTISAELARARREKMDLAAVQELHVVLAQHIMDYLQHEEEFEIRWERKHFQRNAKRNAKNARLMAERRLSHPAHRKPRNYVPPFEVPGVDTDPLAAIQQALGSGRPPSKPEQGDNMPIGKTPDPSQQAPDLSQFQFNPDDPEYQAFLRGGPGISPSGEEPPE